MKREYLKHSVTGEIRCDENISYKEFRLGGWKPVTIPARYRPFVAPNTNSARMIIDMESGDWVLWDDVKDDLAELTRLRRMSE